MCQKEWKDLGDPEALNRNELAFGPFLSQCWYRTRHSLKSWSIYLITVKKMTLPKVHQRKCTLEMINMLTFSAFPDLMWQQRSNKENLFHSPTPFAVLMFLLSSPLCDHEALYSHWHPWRINTLELGARIWSGEVQTRPLSRSGSTLQDDWDQQLNVGAIICTHFAWSDAARLETPWITGRGVSTRKPGAIPVLRRWPLYSTSFALLHILTRFLITWSCGNRPVIQAIFVLIASGCPCHLAYVQNEDRRAFMGVKFYNESLIYKTEHILMGGWETCFDHELFSAINLLLCSPEMHGKLLLCKVSAVIQWFYL